MRHMGAETPMMMLEFMESASSIGDVTTIREGVSASVSVTGMTVGAAGTGKA